MYSKFANWLDKALDRELPLGIGAFIFNLYEDIDKFWTIELAGTTAFDESHEDWACDEVFVPGGRSLTWYEDTDWASILCQMESIILCYLNGGRQGVSRCCGRLCGW